jgi:glutamyl-tRNA synthetase
MKDQEVRVRFAPSPTGPLHIGGVRTALFNYLFARKYNGKFIVRIEDTDQTRFVPGAEQYIIDSLNWCNIKIDEGVGSGGDYAPYKQSERKEIYKQYATQLIEAGHAYFAFDTPPEIEAMRERLKAEKSSNQQYNFLTRDGMQNSLTLPNTDVQAKIDEGHAYVIRLKVPQDETIEFTDLVYGQIAFASSQLDDKILFKSDGMPTYHLANVVDDHLMKISHVIRGSEWINSTPSHVLLYKFLGWSLPEFAHMPLILKPSGKGKLSKRDGDAAGFPVFPLQWTNPENEETSSGYKESGYFPDAFINILALLGWNPGTEQEVMTLDEMIQSFSLEKINKSGARFDPEKAKWFNHQYLLGKNNKELAELYLPILKEKGLYPDFSFVEEIVSLIKERSNFISDFWGQSSYFFKTPAEYDAKVVKKRWKEDSPATLLEIKDILTSLTDFSESNTDAAVKIFMEENELGFGKVLNALRLAIVGSGMGAGIFKIMAIIGKDESLLRIEKAVNEIKK